MGTNHDIEDQGYLLPGIDFKMKMAAIKAYNRTSGKCSPVSIVDAVKAAIDAMPTNDMNRIASTELSIRIYDWLVAIGKLDAGIIYHNDAIMSVLENFAVQAAAKSNDVYKDTVMAIRGILERGDWLTPGQSQNVITAVQRVCAAKRPPNRHTEAEQLGIDLRNLLISYGIGDYRLTGPQVYDIVLGYVQAHKGEERPDPSPVATLTESEADYLNSFKWFKAGGDIKQEGYLTGYTIDSYGHGGLVTVYNQGLRDWILAKLTSALTRQDEADPRGSKAVHHPSHYGGEENPYEVIKVLEAWLSYDEFVGAMKFNIHKYLARAPHKAVELEDYEKGMWYTARLVDYMKRHPR